MLLDFLNVISTKDRLYQLFDLNGEFNIAATFNALLFAVCSFFILQTSTHEDSSYLRKAQWLFLAAIFLFLACDEFFQFHENQPKAWNVKSQFWFIYYLIGLAGLGALYARHFLTMPLKTVLILGASLVIFLTGAVGLESVSLHFARAEQWVLWRLFLVAEETLELIGLLTFSYGLNSYDGAQFKNTWFFQTPKQEHQNDSPTAASSESPACAALGPWAWLLPSFLKAHNVQLRGCPNRQPGIINAFAEEHTLLLTDFHFLRHLCKDVECLKSDLPGMIKSRRRFRRADATCQADLQDKQLGKKQ
jgi:hypothetical protein